MNSTGSTRSTLLPTLPRTLLLALLAAFAASGATAQDGKPQKQPQMKMMRFDADKAVIIGETGMVVTETDGKLKVEFVPPKDRRPKETADLDLEAGDEVGMAMGKKVSTAKDLRAAYEGVKTGGEVKIGLRRNGQAFIVAFRKMDQKDLPGTMVIKREGGDPDTDVLPALGVAIRLHDGAVMISEVFPNGPKEMAKGDVILSLNGKDVKNLADFSGVYDRVEVDGELRFELKREGKAVTVVTKRPRPQGEVKVH